MCKECVEYKSFDELPMELQEKFKSRAKGLKLDEAKDGYVDFINQLNQQGDVLAGEYITASTKTQVKFGKCGHIATIQSNSYKSGVGCGICNGRQVQQGVNDLATIQPRLAKEWHPIKNGELTPHDVTQYSGKKIWWRCDNQHEWKQSVSVRTSMNCNCPFCSNKKVLKGYNDIATTHPQYVKYFVNIGDTYSYSVRSGKKVELKCPSCGLVKIMTISKLTGRGFSCNLCSDGYSFCEKLMASVLTKLGIEFIKQMSYDNGEHRYDFYLPKYNVILETHGRQHYEQGFKKFGKSLEEEQANDKYKRELAISNGILNENYHEIDCRYSTLEWCRPNIEKSLSGYIDTSVLTDKDWKEIDIRSQKSLKTEVCKYWNENKEANSELTTQQVADVFLVSIDTIRNYLKWGNINGLCSYDSKEETRKSGRRNGGGGFSEKNAKLTYLIKPNGDKWFEKTMSIAKLERATGISQRTIARFLDKGGLKAHKNAKYDPKYIGSRIVSAEVYDSQTQTS